MAEKLLSRLDFEREFGVKKTTYYKLLRGPLRAVKMGSRTYVRREDAEAWAKSLPDYQPRGDR
jgi:hypothetical protein